MANLFDLAQYQDKRHTQVLADTPEAKLVLFSLQDGQQVRGSGEPRVHLLALEGEGELWSGEERLVARAGTMLAAAPGEAHGAKAGSGRFLVLGIITPRP